MPFELAEHLLHIEHIGVWTLAPFLIVLAGGLALTVAWIFRGARGR